MCPAVSVLCHAHHRGLSRQARDTQTPLLLAPGPLGAVSPALVRADARTAAVAVVERPGSGQSLRHRGTPSAFLSTVSRHSPGSGVTSQRPRGLLVLVSDRGLAPACVSWAQAVLTLALEPVVGDSLQRRFRGPSVWCERYECARF